MTEQPEKPADTAAEVQLHKFGKNAVCTVCGMTEAEAYTLGPRCVFTEKPKPNRAGLVDAAGQPINPDVPDTVILHDGAEGVKIPDPGDIMAWVMAAGHLMARALNRLGQLYKEHKRTDLKYSIRWAISPVGDELHCEMKVRLP